MEKINLAVIFGGQSGEHEISLSSAKSVIKALDRKKYNIIPIAITKKGNWLIGEKGEKYLKIHAEKIGKENAISLKDSQSLATIKEKSLTHYAEGEIGNGKIDLVLPILHGPYGEDGKVQGMLDMFGLPYVFSGVLAQAIAMHKPKAKIIAQSAGVTVASGLIFNKNQPLEAEQVIEKLALPIVIKPAELGSSVGITIAKTKEELENGIRKAFRHGQEILLEKYIKGRELTATVMGNEKPRVLAITEIIPVISEFYDYKAKYEEGGSRHICPAKLPNKIASEIKNCAVKIFKALGCQDLARADFILDEKGEKYYFIEINTIPGMTSVSLAPEAAKFAGLDFPQFLDTLIQGALKRKNKQ